MSKIPTGRESALPTPHFHRRGFALVLVLSFLVLITGLVLAFFSSVTTDSTATRSYTSQVSVNQLADSAVQTVMGQIRTATSRGSNIAWASQPGMIRTYGDGTNNVASSAPLAYYKLYSSDDMEVTVSEISGFDPVGDLKSGTGSTITDWATQPALFTDLNAPVSGVYPIVDPTALGSVEGFSVVSTGSTSPVVNGGNAAPMPVKWLYVLKDGSLTAPSGPGTSGSMASWSGLSSSLNYKKPSAANPIVGRIAFWTDDETCKVNINTACGAPWDINTNTASYKVSQALAGVTYTVPLPGNYWDIPVTSAAQEKNLAYSQPWAGEYQRYPGHPATVSYAGVFKSNFSANNMYDVTSLTPRYYGTSASVGSWWGRTITTGTATALYRKIDRLYANVGEFLFTANRSNNPTLTSTNVKVADFFLTASSRAPDVTLFNTPRVILWPEWGDSSKRNVFDKYIARMIGSVPFVTSGPYNQCYYFIRDNPYSPTADYANNTRLIAYLRSMTTSAVPGFGGSQGILGKYGADSEQILTEIFDYIRCTNIQDSSTGSTSFSPDGVVVPTTGANGTQGFGRMPTITKVGLLFSSGTSQGAANLVLETFIPGHGYPQVFTNTSGVATTAYQVTVTGLSSFQWGAAASFPNTVNYTKYAKPNNLQEVTPSLAGRKAIQSFNNGASVNFPLWSGTNTFALTGGTLTITSTYNGVPIQTINNLALPSVSGLPVPTSGTAPVATPLWPRIINQYGTDVVRSVQIACGDYRLAAASGTVNAQTTVSGTTFFAPHPYYFDVSGTNGCRAHTFAEGIEYVAAGASLYRDAYYNSSLTTGTLYGTTTNWSTTGFRWDNGDMIMLKDPTQTQGLLKNGDFDNGYGCTPDGPYIGFPDEGVSTTRSGATDFGWQPYFSLSANTMAVLGPGYFSPNRLVPSAGIMGSLSTGVISKTPWQTLLFRPAALTDPSHPGLGMGNPGTTASTNAADCLLLDLFNMPVVEPYAISEPLSTAGRINMNYQIAPFTYITRSTALEAALHMERVTAIPTSFLTNPGVARKHWDSTRTAPFLDGTQTAYMTRYPLNLSATNGTLVGFENRFAAKDIFRSAAEICSIPLVPQSVSVSGTDINGSMRNWWANYTPTGENSKERPYARIYPKLTTKSNSYTVHFRVQVLKKVPSTDPAVWDESRDVVLSEARGSSLIERYVDPSDSNLPDFATLLVSSPSDAKLNIEQYYRFRVIQTRKFAP